MKKTASRLLALALTASLVLSGCSSSGGTQEQTGTESETGSTTETTESTESSETEETAQTEHEPITDLVLAKVSSSELATFNLLNSETSADTQYLTNIWDGLLEVNNYGELVPCIAEEWSTEDGGLTWTFNLRDNATWVDVNGNEMAQVTAQDFLTGMEWVLNFYKNDSANTSMPMEMIEGAEEYYEYTKSLTQEEAYALDASEGSVFREMVNIETPDDYTLVYHCTTEKPYFDTVCAYTCMYPLAQGLVDELGIDGIKSMNNENMWYNVGSQRIEVWFLGYAGVDNSVVVRGLDADHLTELGAFACIQRFGFLFAQGLGVLIVLLCARDHFHRHCGVVGIVLVEVEYPLQAGCKVVCYNVCFLVAVHVYPLRIVAELEGPGQTAVLRTPLFRDTRNQLALRVGLQQAVHQAGQVLAVLSTLCVQDVEGLQLSGCQSWDVQVLDGVFGGIAGACTGLALRASFSVAACVAAAAASCQDHCCCQRQREQSGKCLFHDWLFLLRLSEALL